MEQIYYRNNAGGWNKCHEQLEQFPRIDSYEVTDSEDSWGSLFCAGHLLEMYHEKGEDTCTLLPFHTHETEIHLSRKRNGFGGEQVFFLCPACGKRVRYLYITGTNFRCRRCAQLNYKSQQQTRDSMIYYWKGVEYVKEHLEPHPFGWPDGFAFCDYVPDKPRGMHESTYQRHLARFIKYREKHTERSLADLRRILGVAAWAEVLRLTDT